MKPSPTRMRTGATKANSTALAPRRREPAGGGEVRSGLEAPPFKSQAREARRNTISGRSSWGDEACVECRGGAKIVPHREERKGSPPSRAAHVHGVSSIHSLSLRKCQSSNGGKNR